MTVADVPFSRATSQMRLLIGFILKIISLVALLLGSLNCFAQYSIATTDPRSDKKPKSSSERMLQSMQLADKTEFVSDRSSPLLSLPIELHLAQMLAGDWLSEVNCTNGRKIYASIEAKPIAHNQGSRLMVNLQWYRVSDDQFVAERSGWTRTALVNYFSPKFDYGAVFPLSAGGSRGGSAGAAISRNEQDTANLSYPLRFERFNQSLQVKTRRSDCQDIVFSKTDTPVRHLDLVPGAPRAAPPSDERVKSLVARQLKTNSSNVTLARPLHTRFPSSNTQIAGSSEKQDWYIFPYCVDRADACFSGSKVMWNALFVESLSGRILFTRRISDVLTVCMLDQSTATCKPRDALASASLVLAGYERDWYARARLIDHVHKVSAGIEVLEPPSRMEIAALFIGALLSSGSGSSGSRSATEQADAEQTEEILSRQNRAFEWASQERGRQPDDYRGY